MWSELHFVLGKELCQHKALLDAHLTETRVTYVARKPRWPLPAWSFHRTCLRSRSWNGLSSDFAHLSPFPSPAGFSFSFRHGECQLFHPAFLRSQRYPPKGHQAHFLSLSVSGSCIKQSNFCLLPGNFPPETPTVLPPCGPSFLTGLLYLLPCNK